MTCTLLLFQLNTHSNFHRSKQVACAAPADTLQFLMIDELAWKVLSYGDDLHLQLWRMGKVAPQRFEAVVQANVLGYHRATVRQQAVFSQIADLATLAQQVEASLGGTLHITHDGGPFAYWVPGPGYAFRPSARPYPDSQAPSATA